MKRNWTTLVDECRYTETDEAFYFEDGSVIEKPQQDFFLKVVSGGEHDIDFSAWTDDQRREAARAWMNRI